MKASIRDIGLFVAAYEERSFTSAAQREGATQSGVSQHIGKLEDMLGLRLFLRRKIGIEPTPAADAFYTRCIELLRLHDGAHTALKDFEGGFEGKISAGVMPMMNRCVLRPALVSFIDAHPNATVRIVEGFSGPLTDQVVAGELDFAIVPASKETRGLRSRRLICVPELLVSRANGSGEEYGSVRLADLDPLNLVLPSRENVRRTILESYFDSHGVKIHRRLELDSLLGTVSFVAESDWMAIMPTIFVSDPRDHETFCLRRIVDPPIDVELVLISAARKPISPVAEAFVEVLTQELHRLSGMWKQRLES